MTVNSFNLPYALRYIYLASDDSLIIGTDPIPYGTCTTFSIASNTFCVFIDNASKPAAASVTCDDFNGTYLLSLGTPQRQFDAQTAAVVVKAVPEPASWAMMISGFGLMGLATRRRAKVGMAIR